MTRNGIFAIVLAAGLGLGLVAIGPQPAAAQSDQWNALYDRIIRLEHEIRGLQAGGGAQFPAVSAEADGGQRLVAIEDQLRRMIAQLEEIRRAQQTLEMRLDRLEGGGGPTGSTGTIFDQQRESPPLQYGAEFDLSQYQSRELAALAAQQDVTVEAYRDDQTFTQGEYRQTAPGPQVLGTLRSPGFSEQQQYPQTGGDNAGGSSLVPDAVEQAALDGSPVPSTGSTGASDGLYQSAYDSLLGRRFGEAEAGFKLFLSRNGDHPLAGDAHYWLGETYYVQGDYKEAAQSFLKGYRAYPDSGKAPDTLFKLALSLKQLKQTEQACSTFAEVAKTYPTAAEIRNEALKEMSRAGC